MSMKDVAATLLEPEESDEDNELSEEEYETNEITDPFSSTEPLPSMRKRARTATGKR